MPEFLYERGFMGTLYASAAVARHHMERTLECMGLPAWGPGRVGLMSKLLDGPMSQVEVARFLNISPPSAMELVKRLERDGFVTRTRDTCDARCMAVALTPDARARVVAMRFRLTDQMAVCEGELERQGFTQADIDRCKALLRMFSDLMQQDMARMDPEEAHTLDRAKGAAPA